MRLITFLILSLFSVLAAAQASEPSKSLYETVIENGKIKCAYYTWPPYFSKNLQTGEFEGFAYDITEAIADSLKLDVEWVLELNPGDQVTALQTNKADAICAIDGPFKPHTTKDLIYSDPPILVPLYLYARSDDTRFDADQTKANQTDVKVSVIDGDIVHDLAKIHFPNAQHMSLQLLGAPGQMMQDVMTNKADVLINDELTMAEFHKAHPDKIKRVNEAPLAVIPLTFSVLRSDDSMAFVDMINQAIKNLNVYGTADAVIDVYDPDRKYFMRPAKPYGHQE